MPRSQGVSEQVANEAYDATEAAAAAAGDLDTTFNDARKKRCGTSAASSTHTQLTRARAVVRGGHGVAYSHHHLMQLELSRTTPPTATACAPVLGAQTGLSGRLPLSSSPLGRPRVVRWYHELPTNSPLPPDCRLARVRAHCDIPAAAPAAVVVEAGKAAPKFKPLRSKAARDVWNPDVKCEVDPPSASSLRAAPPLSVSAELLRMQLCKKLRNVLHKVREGERGVRGRGRGEVDAS
jgi:hypothetical protein